MLLKRNETTDIVEVVYDSSNILSSTFNKLTNELQIVFGKGDTYSYESVNPTDYLRFELAESQGKVFNSHIKKYPFKKTITIDPITLITEAAKLRAEEAKALVDRKEKVLVNYMKTLLAGPSTNQITDI